MIELQRSFAGSSSKRFSDPSGDVEMAPNKKYLSLEEAAALIGIKVDELVRFREKGDVRGFADRGTWKFKADDVAEFRRRRQPDSDPDLPIMDDSYDDDDDQGRQATVIRKGGGAKSDSDVRLMSSDGNKTNRLTGSSGEVPTLDPGQSDSDVRLIEPPKKPKKGSDSDVTLVKPKLASKSDSDSDVKMFDLPLSAPDSDSDVMLLDPLGSKLDSDSDVRLSSSDSDVRLSPLSSSDSDVKLIGPGAKGLKRSSDSDVTLLSKQKARDDINAKTQDMGPLVPAKRGSDLIPGSSRDHGSVLADDDDSAITLSGDSGIQLAGDSGIRLASDSASRLAGDSGIRLDAESGIRLGTSSGIRIDGDSGIRLADDSGVELRRPTDSGISLEGPDSDIRLADSGINFGGDSGINLMADSSSKKLRGGSSKKLKGSAQPQEDDLDMTSPMLLSSLDEDDDLGHTSPLLAASNISDPEMFDGSDTSEMQSLGDSGQNVVMFDDEDEDSTPAAKKPRQRTVEESIFEMDEVGDELEVSDDDLSGEHEIDDLAFDDDEDSQAEGFTAGTSQLGYGTAQKLTVAQETEWSAGFFSLLLASVCVMIFGSLISADMLHIVWADGSAVNHGFAGLMGGLWK